MILGANAHIYALPGLHKKLIKNVFSQRILDGFSQHLAEHTDITTQRGILFVHMTPDTPSLM